MTKMSSKRKIDKKLLPVRNFYPSEITELQEMQRLVNGRIFELTQVKNNTALVPDGQKYIEQLEAIVQILNNIKGQWVSQKLVECGYEPGARLSINMISGEIVPTPAEEILKEVEKETKDEPKDSK